MIEPKKILVAEDDENDAELILKALEKYNIANGVIIVEDGAEALDYLYRRGDYETRADGNPVLVLLDIKMPRVDGLEVLREIRADERLKMIPAVMLFGRRATCSSAINSASTPTSSSRWTSTNSSRRSESLAFFG